MADLHLLYTVTCRREPFYAVVESGKGRVWTAPTKDGAIRQARDAGITQFTERTISRENFLRSLGIVDSPRPRIERDAVPQQPPEPQPEPSSPGAWFVAGAGSADDDAISQDFSIPRSFSSGRNKLRPPKGGALFAGVEPIPPLTRIELAAGSEDILIVPASQREAPKATPFTDSPPPEIPEGTG